MLCTAKSRSRTGGVASVSTSKPKVKIVWRAPKAPRAQQQCHPVEPGLANVQLVEKRIMCTETCLKKPISCIKVSTIVPMKLCKRGSVVQACREILLGEYVGGSTASGAKWSSGEVVFAFQTACRGSVRCLNVASKVLVSGCCFRRNLKFGWKDEKLRPGGRGLSWSQFLEFVFWPTQASDFASTQSEGVGRYGQLQELKFKLPNG